MIEVQAPGRQELSTQRFSQAFQRSFPFPAALDPHLEEALRHVLDHPGSLIRPSMVMQMAAACGLEDTAARDLAIALEYFHSASLLFDDLPCMDNALERRGVPCAHLVFGEASAILAALSLINRAYALTWRALAASRMDRQPRAMAYVEQCLGVDGLLNGQSLDLHYHLLPHTARTTESIARGKTVSLIRLTLVLPAMLGDASARELQLLERLSAYWGLAYQVLDDLKDVLQDAAESGKTPARDLTLDRPNSAAVLGVPVALHRAGRLIRAGERTLRHLLQARPALDFLESLRGRLEGELLRLRLAASGKQPGERL
jgi:geranylgeranyl pyrophosphate synthase